MEERPETHFARGSGEGWSGEERRVLNRFVGGMAIVRVRSRRKEHGRTNGSSVLYIANWPVLISVGISIYDNNHNGI